MTRKLAQTLLLEYSNCIVDRHTDVVGVCEIDSFDAKQHENKLRIARPIFLRII